VDEEVSRQAAVSSIVFKFKSRRVRIQTAFNISGKFQCCGSGNRDVFSRIPDPDFYPFRVPDPKTATKRAVKKFVVIPFL
jgi:hypothetical protein